MNFYMALLPFLQITYMYFEHLLFFSALTVNVLCTGKIVPNETWSLCLRKDDAEREGVSYSEAFLKSKCKLVQCLTEMY